MIASTAVVRPVEPEIVAAKEEPPREIVWIKAVLKDDGNACEGVGKMSDSRPEAGSGRRTSRFFSSGMASLVWAGAPPRRHCVQVGELTRVVDTVGTAPMRVKSTTTSKRAKAPTLRSNHSRACYSFAYKCRVRGIFFITFPGVREENKAEGKHTRAQLGVESRTVTNSTMLA